MTAAPEGSDHADIHLEWPSCGRKSPTARLTGQTRHDMTARGLFGLFAVQDQPKWRFL